jgi:hypothetical protein
MKQILVLLLLSANLNCLTWADSLTLEGVWRGELVAARYDPVQLVLTIQQNSDAYSANLDIPSQFRAGLPAASIGLRGNTIIIRFPAIQAEFYGELVLSQDERQVMALSGDWSQSGENVPLLLNRVTP